MPLQDASELDRQNGGAGDQCGEHEQREPHRHAKARPVVASDVDGRADRETERETERERRPQLVEDQAGERVWQQIGVTTRK